MRDTIGSVCRFLTKKFIKSFSDYEKYQDIMNFLECMKKMSIMNLKDHLNSFEDMYHSKNIIENLAIIVQSVILAMFTLDQSRTTLRPDEFQDFFESLSFICYSHGYEKSTQLLYEKSLVTLRNAAQSYDNPAENYDIQYLLKLGDAIYDIRDILNHNYEELNQLICRKLITSFRNCILSNFQLEFLEFNKRYKKASENFIKNQKANQNWKKKLRRILSLLKFDDIGLNKMIENELKSQEEMIDEIQYTYQKFTFHRYKIPEIKFIKNVENYSIHSLMNQEKVAQKSIKYFFKVITNNKIKSILKVTRFIKLSSKEYNIFKLTEDEQECNLALPKIHGICYSHEDLISIAKNRRRYKKESNPFTSNVLKLFFEKFELYKNICVSEDLIYHSIGRLIETLKLMNNQKLFVPILLENNLAVNEEQTKIYFVDFKKIKTSENFRFDAIQGSWLIEKFRNCSHWLEKIGVGCDGEVYHIETLQLWSLATIFKRTIIFRNEGWDRRTKLSELLDKMSQTSILFGDILCDTPVSETDSNFSFKSGI